MKSVGYDVVEAADGKLGVDKVRMESPDLIVTDLNMPNMNGLDFLKAVRGLPNGQKVPVLLLTTESSAGLKEQARLAGATGWLVKPFDPQKLVDVVKKVLP